MQTNAVPKNPNLWVPKLKVDPKEEYDPATISCSKNEKLTDFLKYNGKGSSCNDAFMKSGPIRRIENVKEELDQQESDSCLEESTFIKLLETRSFNKIQIGSNDSNIEKVFDYDVVELQAIKKENDVNKIENEELYCSHESPTVIKSEIIVKEEVHIQEDGEDKLNEKFPNLKKQTELHQCSECPYVTSRKLDLNLHLHNKHKKKDKVYWYGCRQCPYNTFREKALISHTKIHNSEQSKINLTKEYEVFHNQNLWFQCPVCAYKTCRKYSFKKHQVLHQGKNGEDWIRCLKCPYKALDKYDLQKHKITHRCFKCSQCKFKTEYKGSLNRHQLQKHKKLKSFFIKAP